MIASDCLPGRVLLPGRAVDCLAIHGNCERVTASSGSAFLGHYGEAGATGLNRQNGRMKFRPLRADDLPGPEWMGEVELRPDGWRDEHTRSAVLIDSDRVVAVGIIWTSRVHGDRYWVEVVVDPNRRREGLGTAMLEHLAELRHAPLAFQTRGYVDEDRLAFADALGARTIQIVPPALIDVGNRIALRPHPFVRPAITVSWDQLLSANARIYEWTHASWSPVGESFAAALSEGLEEEIDLEATHVAIDDGAIRAMTVAYHDSEPPIVTAEATSPDDPDGERLVEGCVRATLDVFASRGVSAVEFDGHVSDPHFHPVWVRLGPTGRWFRIVEVDTRLR